MGDFNKVLSFILGLIVVVVFFVVLSGRLNLSTKLLPGSQTKITPTVTPTPKVAKKPGFFERLFAKKNPTPTPTPTEKTTTKITYNNYQTGQPIVTSGQTKGGTTGQTATAPTQTKGGQKTAEIPQTGPETALLPVFISTLLAGLYLRKKN